MVFKNTYNKRFRQNEFGEAAILGRPNASHNYPPNPILNPNPTTLSYPQRDMLQRTTPES
jgi:hypothetical protein